MSIHNYLNAIKTPRWVDDLLRTFCTCFYSSLHIKEKMKNVHILTIHIQKSNKILNNQKYSFYTYREILGNDPFHPRSQVWLVFLSISKTKTKYQKNMNHRSTI